MLGDCIDALERTSNLVLEVCIPILIFLLCFAFILDYHLDHSGSNLLVLPACPLLQAPPGAGKTTAIPLALLHHSSFLKGQSILVLEPRIVAAK